MSRAARPTIGIVREGYNKWERRVPLTPSHVRELVSEFGLRILVQPCHRRVFPDAEFIAAGAEMSEDLSNASLIMGVKAMPKDSLLADKSYLFFSHTIKAQAENMALLDTCLAKRIRLIDYECITADGTRSAPRLVAFGEYAGKAGMINTFRGLGEQLLANGLSTPFLSVPSSYMHPDLASARASVWRMGERIACEGLPRDLGPVIFAFTGNGNVSRGAQGVFDLLPHEMVSVSDLEALCASADGGGTGYNRHQVYGVVVEEEDMVTPLDGRVSFDRTEYYEHPERFRGIFHERVAPYVSALINCTYWDQRYPRLLTTRQLNDLHAEGRLRMIGVSDISCDENGSLEFLNRITSVESPYFATDPSTGMDHDTMHPGSIMMQAVDILPSELPREASTHFGDVLLPFVPAMAASDPELPLDEAELPAPIRGACITSRGALTEPFEYISDMRKAAEREAEQAPVASTHSSTSGAGTGAAAGHSGPNVTMLLQGHIFDTGLINRVLDAIETAGCKFRIKECLVGSDERKRTSMVLAVTASDAGTLSDVASNVQQLTAVASKGDATCELIENSGIVHTTSAAPSASLQLSSAAAGATHSAQSKVVVLGAGLVAAPCIEYLARDPTCHVKVVSAVEGEAEGLLASLPADAHAGAGTSCACIDVGNDTEALDALVDEADLVISLLPAPMHPDVARRCIQHGTDMVTASYVSDEMRALDAAARDAGIVVMNEVGVDPGMDHMSAMSVIDEIRREGGKITEFSSLCGGLPAPEAADNPLGYKFSWSPAGVFSAAKNASRYMLDGELVEVPGEALLRSAQPAVTAWPALNLEQLPNRDALPYGELYGIDDTAKTVYRGTLRYAGWASVMYGFSRLGMLDDAPRDALPAAWADMMALLDYSGEAAVQAELQRIASTDSDPASAEAAAKTAEALAWLGVFDADEPVAARGSTMGAFCALLENKLAYAPLERDVILMHHEFGVETATGAKEKRTSSLIAYGEPGGETAMARTVGITTAIAAELVLGGKVTQRGMLTPVAEEVYKPALAKLEKEGFAFSEQTIGL